MITHPELIQNAQQVQDLVSALAQEKVIAFDTEFIRESTLFPVVEIIQVATTKDAWLVDARAFKKKHGHGPEGGYDHAIDPLLNVFKDTDVLKIVHAAQGDQECLYTAFGCVASPVLDTAVAASLCGMGDSLGLSRLLQDVLGVELKKGHARTNWSVRPLPEQLSHYALQDVVYLVELGERFIDELGKRERLAWALELSARFEDPTLYDPKPEALAKKIGRGKRMDRKEYSVLCELVRWREKRVRDLNLPRRWVAEDAVLLDLAKVRPKDLEHLAAFRGLNRGEIKNSGKAILEAVLKGEAECGSEDFKLPKATRDREPSATEGQVIELLRCYLGILAGRHEIALKHLATVDQLLPLIRKKYSTPEELVQNGILGPEAARLVGAELLAFLSGQQALGISDGRVRAIDLTRENS